MVALRPGTAEFEAAFGAAINQFEQFKSQFPTYHEIQNSWIDPSIGAALGLDRFETTAAKSVKDLANGCRILMFDLGAALLGRRGEKFMERRAA